MKDAAFHIKGAGKLGKAFAHGFPPAADCFLFLPACAPTLPKVPKTIDHVF